MAYSTLRTTTDFELSTGAASSSWSSSKKINYISIPTPEGVKSIIDALKYCLQVPPGQSFLVQFWAAIEIGNTYVLTTTSQPFGICGINNQELEIYRRACLDHKLYVHPEKRVAFGLPGRVFLNRFPEETQNVHKYPKDHRPPCQDDSIFTKIWGSFGVPVINEANKCVGVLEFITDPPQDSYDNDIHVVYDALERDGFQSSIPTHPLTKEVVTTSPSPHESKRINKSSKITYRCLVQYFGLTSAEAAKMLNLTQSTFDNVRRRVGIPEWPWLRPISHNKKKTTTSCISAFSAMETNHQTTSGTTTPSSGITISTSYDDLMDVDVRINGNTAGAYIINPTSFGTADQVATGDIYNDYNLPFMPISISWDDVGINGNTVGANIINPTSFGTADQVATGDIYNLPFMPISISRDDVGINENTAGAYIINPNSFGTADQVATGDIYNDYHLPFMPISISWDDVGINGNTSGANIINPTSFGTADQVRTCDIYNDYHLPFMPISISRDDVGINGNTVGANIINPTSFGTANQVATGDIYNDYHLPFMPISISRDDVGVNENTAGAYIINPTSFGTADQVATGDIYNDYHLPFMPISISWDDFPYTQNEGGSVAGSESNNYIYE